ncbi:hypothetical protein H5410_065004 [Solanum commersonii]|uniref:Uncharacterized protein n=1 Tax=Solanum commersonii TaxID=4109 RepID=A0A9J5VXR0_SOLCO|nr:hypothetical protein H5410_065004 [Solanum commersonii]
MEATSQDATNQASQVFYASDNSNKGWHVVRKTQPRDSYEMGKQMDDEDVVVDLESPSQKKRKTTTSMRLRRGRGLKSLTSKEKFQLRVHYLNLVILLRNTSKLKQDKFESVDLNDHRDHIFGWMNELWNKWRGYLHATYVKNKPIVQALRIFQRE